MKKVLLCSFLLSIVVSAFLTLLTISFHNRDINAFYEQKVISYPKESYRKGYSNIKFSFTLKLPNDSNVIETKRNISTYENLDILSIENNKLHNHASNVEIIPVRTDKNNSALDLLDSYLVRYVGTIGKDNQKVYFYKSFDVAEVSYIPFESEGEKWVRIFTIYKKNNYAWIFSQGFYTSEEIDDSLNFDGNNITKEYKNLLNTFNVLQDFNKKNFNVIDNTTVDKERLEDFLNNNITFNTYIK